jgi:hypothetical protein
LATRFEAAEWKIGATTAGPAAANEEQDRRFIVNDWELVSLKFGVWSVECGLERWDEVEAIW